MFRLLFIPVVFVMVLIVGFIIAYLVYRKIKQGIHYTVKKGEAFVSEQQQKNKEKEQLETRKQYPELLQKGYESYDELAKTVQSLPQEWKVLLDPLLIQSKQILDEVTYNILEQKNEKPMNSVRSFFHHSLDSQLQFAKKLHDDYHYMSSSQIEKARQNITLFQADLNRHQQTLAKSREMDFDVLMDVIKARLNQ